MTAVNTDVDEALHQLARRALDLYEAKTTALAPTTMSLPVEAYLDAERWSRELDRIFKQLPLGLALTAEFPTAGCYRAMDVLGIPVLMVRGDDGMMRAFINTCRHRGAPLCQLGAGQARRFTCPYHAWSYDERGTLVGMFGASTFGEVDRAELALKALPVAERAGFVWVGLTPDTVFDIDEWLGDFAVELETLRLDEWFVHEQRELPGPGWKVTFDGYLEGYHQQALHPETVGKTTIANLMVHDTYGPHQRIVFGRTNLGELAGIPEPDWMPADHIRLIHSVFPNLSVSGIIGDHALVSQVFPGPTVERTTTVQTIMVRQPVTTPESEAAARQFSDMVLQAVRDEDYAMGFRIQDALASGGNDAFVFGRNEPSLQHYHSWVERLSQ